MLNVLFVVLVALIALPLLVLVGLALGPVIGVLVLVSAFAAPLVLVGGAVLRNARRT